MDRLRPRARKDFSGFTNAEVEKMEKLLQRRGEQVLEKEFCKKLAKNFTQSSGRAGKPLVKLIEVQNWFKDVLEKFPEKKVAQNTEPAGGRESEEKKSPDVSELEFEARSSKDGAWYDVDMFLAHRILCTGEAEVRIRFVGFGAEEDEWVNVKKSVRVRSLPLEQYECQKVNEGDPLLCLQERNDQAIYYDVRVLGVERKLHDIRGCRCIFLVRYEHDGSEEEVRLRRLCWRLT